MLNRVEKDHIEHQPVRIGTLLVNEGYIRKADLAEAIETQHKESQATELALGKLLVKNGLISKHQLQILLEHPELREDIGTFAVEKGLIGQHQLSECLRKKPQQQPLAEALVADGYLTDRDFKAFIEQQLNSVKLGELAVTLGMISDTSLNQMVHKNRYLRTIGEILCDLNLISPLDLNSVLTKYRKHLKLGEILLKMGLTDRPALETALRRQESRGDLLGKILLQEGILSEDQLFSALAAQFNIPFKKLEGYTYSDHEKEALAKIIGKGFSHQIRTVPLSIEGSTLTVAVADPRNLKAVHSLWSKRVDLRIHCILVTESTLEKLFASLYLDRPWSAALQKAARETAGPPAAPVREISLPAPATPVPEKEEAQPRPPGENRQEAVMSAGQLVHLILQQALTSGADTIHIDKAAHRTTLRFRIGNTLHKPSPEWMEARLQSLVGPVLETIKKLSGLDATCGYRPQDGAFRGDIMAAAAADLASMDFSVATCPTLAGENVTIRRILPCPSAPDLEDLPHSGDIVSSLKRLAKSMSGMVFVAGPPGNGRSATLYGMLRHIQQPGIKAVAVDDALMFSLPEAVQIQTNPAMGLTYAAMLRAALRLDPDVILASDLADPESISIGLEAAQRGILLLGGVYAEDAVGAISQLRTHGMLPRRTPGFLKAVLAERYIRKICPGCSHPYLPAAEEWQPLFERFPDRLAFHKGSGCPDCGFTGYQGRTLLSELIVINDTITRALKGNITETDLRHLIIRSGIRTLIDDGLSKLDQTTLSEIIDAVPQEAAVAFKCTRADTAPAGRPSTEPASPESASHKMVISAPDIPATDIRRLHHAYEALIEKTGRRTHRSTLSTFETFVKTSYQSIRRRYGCSRVVFFVQHRAEKVLLLASPEM